MTRYLIQIQQAYTVWNIGYIMYMLIDTPHSHHPPPPPQQFLQAEWSIYESVN